MARAASPVGHDMATPINSPLEVEGLLAAIAFSAKAPPTSSVDTERMSSFLLYELGIVQPSSQGQEEEEEGLAGDSADYKGGKISCRTR